jgi:hypothetical protein
LFVSLDFLFALFVLCEQSSKGQRGKQQKKIKQENKQRGKNKIQREKKKKKTREQKIFFVPCKFFISL